MVWNIFHSSADFFACLLLRNVYTDPWSILKIKVSCFQAVDLCKFLRFFQILSSHLLPLLVCPIGFLTIFLIFGYYLWPWWLDSLFHYLLALFFCVFLQNIGKNSLFFNIYSDRTISSKSLKMYTVRWRPV